MIKGKRNDDENTHSHTETHKIGKSITVKTSLTFKCSFKKNHWIYCIAITPLRYIHTLHLQLGIYYRSLDKNKQNQYKPITNGFRLHKTPTKTRRKKNTKYEKNPTNCCSHDVSLSAKCSVEIPNSFSLLLIYIYDKKNFIEFNYTIISPLIIYGKYIYKVHTQKHTNTRS